MEKTLLDREPSLTGAVVTTLTDIIGIKNLKVYPFHPQANGTVERWNRTLCRDTSSFVGTGLFDWDQHVALAFFRYKTSVCDAISMAPYKDMFSTDAFETWSELEMDTAENETDDLAAKVARLHKLLVNNATKARIRAAKYCDQAVRETECNGGDRVLPWDCELSTKENNKKVRLWI